MVGLWKSVAVHCWYPGGLGSGNITITEPIILIWTSHYEIGC